ncbi:protein RCC2 homolog [Lucilia cuprina]|uniref:protein RCC2 homolog n=1 Tax=Lucilia cuprina TaxID=7375 RepID=UPI001F050C34|nr:protein RCC2 homolog [Lucilia cuprina]XP_046812405.1 protein RCC2 homolog [Lucilia cuprina]
MSAKRKAGGNGNGPNKRRPKKKESDYEDEVSDESEDEGAQSSSNQVEVLIPNDDLEPPSKLPDDLLATMEKTPGKMLIAGMVTWDLTGKRDRKNVVKVRPNLYNFHRFTDEKYRYVASGCAAAHTILINMDRKAMAFGRNPSGQLGLPDTKLCEKPTVIPALEKFNIVQAAVGRHHSLFLTDTGTVYACGDNKSGQCGIGNTTPNVNTPTLINYRGPPIIRIACGAEFSVILDIKGNLHTFGLPEYGQLGHNTDAKYFVNANKLSFHFETSPKKIVLYIEKSKDGHVTPVEGVQIVDFACGNNHTVAIDSKKRVYSWGFGGFGRLGHAEPKDEMVPRLIKFFDIGGRGGRSVYCGATYSLVVNELGVLFLFGQNKKTGEANMYPKPVQDLSGWNITAIGCSNTSIIISADDTLIAWGASPTYGELGLGEFQKSSTVPKEVPKMDSMKIPQVAMGYSHAVLLVDTDNEATEGKYEKLPEYTIDD